LKTATFNAIAILVGALVVTAIAAIAWHTANEGDVPEYDGKDILITVDYVTHCQKMTEECYAAADAAIDAALKDGRTTAACMARRPSRRAIARGALIWLNAHVELHPLPVDEGIARAMDAVWPCPSRQGRVDTLPLSTAEVRAEGEPRSTRPCASG